MNDISGLPVIHNYYETTKDVTGGNKSVKTEMVNKVEEFLDSGGFGHLIEDSGYIALKARDSSALIGIKGSQTRKRVDIQGPEGSSAVRIAYQVAGKVIAQIVIPINKRISRNEFLEAFETSIREKKVVTFVNPGEENIPPTHSRVRKKG